LVENRRIEGKVRQKVLAYVGTSDDLGYQILTLCDHDYHDKNQKAIQLLLAQPGAQKSLRKALKKLQKMLVENKKDGWDHYIGFRYNKYNRTRHEHGDDYEREHDKTLLEKCSAHLLHREAIGHHVKVA
jgi:hypothetical protein